MTPERLEQLRKQTEFTEADQDECLDEIQRLKVELESADDELAASYGCMRTERLSSPASKGEVERPRAASFEIIGPGPNGYGGFGANEEKPKPINPATKLERPKRPEKIFETITTQGMTYLQGLESCLDALESKQTPSDDYIRACGKLKEVAECIYRAGDNVETENENFYKIGPAWMERLGDALRAVDVASRALPSPSEKWRDELDDALALIAELTDRDDCHYDHHGYCQAHSLHEKPCPHERAKAFLLPSPKGGEG